MFHDTDGQQPASPSRSRQRLRAQDVVVLFRHLVGKLFVRLRAFFERVKVLDAVHLGVVLGDVAHEALLIRLLGALHLRHDLSVRLLPAALLQQETKPALMSGISSQSFTSHEKGRVSHCISLQAHLPESVSLGLLLRAQVVRLGALQLGAAHA